MTFFGGSNPIGQGGVPAVTSVNGQTGTVVIDVPDDAEITVLATAAANAAQQANADLGALAPAVNAIVSQAITDAASNFNQLSNKTGTLPATQVGSVAFGGTTYTNVQLAISALFGLIQPGGATAPVPNAAPSVAFPGGTGDVGETFTITPGTYTGTQPTVGSVGWNIISNGQVVATISGGAVTGTLTAAMATGARAFAVAEFFSWSGGVNVPGKTSATYTLNAPAAIPVIITGASLTGSALVGQDLTGTVGSWSNTPTSYVKQFYRNGVAIAGATATSAATTLVYTTTSTDAGASITFGVYATNAASGATAPYNGVVQSVSSALIIAGGTAPNWTAPGAVLPGWTFGVFQVGVALVADFGAAANNPAVSGYSYQVLRDGVAIAGASGSNVSAFSYTPTSSDQDHELSFILTASNGAGSASTTTASVTINAASGSGGGGTGSFVGYTTSGRTSTDPGATFTISVPAAAQSGDYALIFVACNSHVNSIDSSWVVEGAEQSTVAPISHKTHVWKKQLGTEPASYLITLSASDNAAAVCAVWRGPTSVITSGTPTLNTASNASPITVTIPSSTTTANNQTSVQFVSMNPTAANVNSFAGPSGSTLRAQVDFLFPPYGNLAIFDQIIAATGATGTFTTVDTTLATANGWHAWNVILG